MGVSTRKIMYCLNEIAYLFSVLKRFRFKISIGSRKVSIKYYSSLNKISKSRNSNSSNFVLMLISLLASNVRFFRGEVAEISGISTFTLTLSSISILGRL